jgi:hypothetical protein
MKKSIDKVRIIIKKIGRALKKKILSFLFYGTFFLLILLWFPCPFKFNVLTVRIPDTSYLIELWERPHFDFFTLMNDYKTWFVFYNDNEKRRWFVIGEKYTSFGKVSVFISDDMNHIKIETNAVGYETTHLIAEYKIKEKDFKARSEKSVRNKPGWKLIAEKKVRD